MKTPTLLEILKKLKERERLLTDWEYELTQTLCVKLELEKEIKPCQLDHIIKIYNNKCVT